MSVRPFPGVTYDFEMSDGIWEGEDADSAVAANGCPGTFGVFCGNWGENFTCQKAQEHMEFDLKSGPCHFVMLSEALPELLAHLREPPPKASPAGDRTEETRGGGETKCEVRPTYRYIGLRGLEPKSSLMIAARASLVKGMRLRYLRLRHDGPYSRKAHSKTSRTQPRTRQMAVSKFLVVT